MRSVLRRRCCRWAGRKIDPYGNNWWCALGGGVSADDDYLERYYRFDNKWTASLTEIYGKESGRPDFVADEEWSTAKSEVKKLAVLGPGPNLAKRTGNRVRESASRRSACSGSAAQSGASDPAWLRGPGHRKIFEASFSVAAPKIPEERVDEDPTGSTERVSRAPRRHRQTLLACAGGTRPACREVAETSFVMTFLYLDETCMGSVSSIRPGQNAREGFRYAAILVVFSAPRGSALVASPHRDGSADADAGFTARQHS